MSQIDEDQKQITQELNETQARLADAVEALAYKKSHLKDDAKAVLEEKKEAVIDSIKDRKEMVLEKVAEKKEEVLETLAEKKEEVLETLRAKVA